MKRGLVLSIVVSLFLLGLSPADAAIRRWSIEPMVYGGPVFMDADLFVEDTLISGASLALSVKPSFQVEVTSSTLTADSERISRAGAEVKMDTVGLRLLGTFLAEEEVRVMPILGLGGGRIETEGRRGAKRQLFTEEAGYAEGIFGARIKLWKDLTLRAAGVLRHARTINESGHEVTHVNFHLEVGVSVFLFGQE